VEGEGKYIKKEKRGRGRTRRWGKGEVEGEQGDK
jgi:hypothetical protein